MNYLNFRYFIGRTGTYPQTQHLYNVSDSLDGAPHNAFCITCSMNTVYTNVNCMHNDASFSYNATYFMVNCGGPDVPEISINKHVSSKPFTSIINYYFNTSVYNNLNLIGNDNMDGFKKNYSEHYFSNNLLFGRTNIFYYFKNAQHLNM